MKVTKLLQNLLGGKVIWLAAALLLLVILIGLINVFLVLAGGQFWLWVAIGSLLTIVITIALVLYGLSNGALRSALDEVFPSRQQMTSAEVEAFLTKAREATQVMGAFADAYQSPDYIVTALDSLTAKTARQKRAEMEAVAVEIRTSCDRLIKSLTYAVETSRGKELTPTQRAAASGGEQAVAAAAEPVRPDNAGLDNIEPDLYYTISVPDPQTGEPDITAASGAQLLRYAQKGAKVNRDFFIIGLASQSPGNPSQTGQARY